MARHRCSPPQVKEEGSPPYCRRLCQLGSLERGPLMKLKRRAYFLRRKKSFSDAQLLQKCVGSRDNPYRPRILSGGNTSSPSTGSLPGGPASMAAGVSDIYPVADMPVSPSLSHACYSSFSATAVAASLLSPSSCSSFSYDTGDTQSPPSPIPSSLGPFSHGGSSWSSVSPPLLPHNNVAVGVSASAATCDSLHVPGSSQSLSQGDGRSPLHQSLDGAQRLRVPETGSRRSRLLRFQLSFLFMFLGALTIGLLGHFQKFERVVFDLDEPTLGDLATEWITERVTACRSFPLASVGDCLVDRRADFHGGFSTRSLLGVDVISSLRRTSAGQSFSKTPSMMDEKEGIQPLGVLKCLRAPETCSWTAGRRSSHLTCVWVPRGLRRLAVLWVVQGKRRTTVRDSNDSLTFPIGGPWWAQIQSLVLLYEVFAGCHTQLPDALIAESAFDEQVLSISSSVWKQWEHAMEETRAGPEKYSRAVYRDEGLVVVSALTSLQNYLSNELAFERGNRSLDLPLFRSLIDKYHLRLFITEGATPFLWTVASLPKLRTLRRQLTRKRTTDSLHLSAISENSGELKNGWIIRTSGFTMLGVHPLPPTSRITRDGEGFGPVTITAFLRLYALSLGTLSPSYPFRALLRRLLATSQLYGVLTGLWLHSFASPHPLTLVHVPRLLFYAAIFLYRVLILYRGLGFFIQWAGLRSFDFSDHVVLYMTAGFIVTVELAAAERSHPRRRKAGGTTVSTASSFLSRKLTNLLRSFSFLAPPADLAESYAVQFAHTYGQALVLCTCYCGFFTAFLYHTRWETITGCLVALLGLYVPFWVLIFSDTLSLDRLGILRRPLLPASSSFHD